MNAKQIILEKIKNGEFALWTKNDICKALHLKKREQNAVESMLRALVNAGELLMDENGRFGTAEEFGAKKGVFRANERGFGFFTPDDNSGDLFIPRRKTGGALNGDIVLCYNSKQKSDDEGEILAIIDHGIKEVVGTFEKVGRFGKLVPDDRHYLAEIFIPAGKSMDAESGDKALAKITSFSDEIKGEIVEILGKTGELKTEENAIIRAYALRENFPESVLEEAKKVSQREITPEEISRRRDLRGELIITVDGEDTRDIDDAISVFEKQGKFYLGVHIADVTHYVRRAKELDKEAFARGTSVYFPDRVLPMLPKALSNGICSLNEGEDRLTLSCFMTIDKTGNILSREIAPTVICSRHRMTYTKVFEIMQKKKEAVEEYPDLVGMLASAAKLTEILQEKRRGQGGVELDIREAKILYENGVIDVPCFERNLAHEMIEEFMVLANESVACIMTERKAPFVYRVHESPSPEKVQGLVTFLRGLGVETRLDPEKVSPKDYANLLKTVETSPAFPVVSRVMLRSMMKAKYSPENIGHFGLASSCYCHFTSPIRRYPDLTIHRIIKDSLRGDGEEALKEKYSEFAATSASHSSATERTAADAERDVDDLFMAFYMQDKIGLEFPALISGVTAQGLYAELLNTVEGFLSLDVLPEGEYAFDEEKLTLKKGAHTFRLGDEIKVKVIGVDIALRRTLFALAEEER